MKKFICLILSVFLCMVLSSCSLAGNLKINSDTGSKATVYSDGATFENGIDFAAENRTQNNASVYLTEDKFYYTTYDSENNFGDGSKLMVYNLKTGEITAPLSIHIGDICNLNYLNGKLYFTGYTNTQTDWGFCLFELDCKTYELKTIHQTPNTVDGISLAVCGDKLFYIASENSQENIDYPGGFSLHMYEDGEDKIMDSHFVQQGSSQILRYDDKGAYVQVEEYASYQHEIAGVEITGYSNYFVDCNGNITKLEDESYSADSSSLQNEKPSEEFKVCADYKNYSITESDIVDDYGEDTDCGYKYKAVYYLYDKQNDKSYQLTEADYWYYYI